MDKEVKAAISERLLKIPILNTARDIPGALMMLVFGISLYAWIEIFVPSNNDKTNKNQRPTRMLLPFVLAVLYIILGHVTSVWKESIYAYVGVILIGWIMIRALRFSLNPLKVIIDLLDIILPKESPGIVKNIAEESASEMFFKQSSVKLTDKRKIYQKITDFSTFASEALVEASDSPKFSLLIFLNYYLICIAMTAGISSVLVKSLFIDANDISFLKCLFFSIDLILTGNMPLITQEVLFWLKPFHALINFFYLILAFLAFSIIAGPSSKSFQQQLKLSLDRELLELKWINLEIQTGKSKEELKKK